MIFPLFSFLLNSIAGGARTHLGTSDYAVLKGEQKPKSRDDSPGTGPAGKIINFPFSICIDTLCSLCYTKSTRIGINYKKKRYF